MAAAAANEKNAQTPQDASHDARNGKQPIAGSISSLLALPQFQKKTREW
jgi:hypothetical protein